MTRIGRTRGPGGVGEGPSAVDGSDGVSSVDAPDAAEATEAVAPVAEVDATAGPGAVDAVTEVAAALKAGSITVDQAVERLIEDAVARHVRLAGPDADAAVLGDQLREELRRFAANDPHLAARIRRLTHAK